MAGSDGIEVSPEQTTGASNRAPGELEHVRAFVNTLDVENATDDIAAAPDLAAFLEARGLVPQGADVTPQDVALARDIREALRELMGQNAGHPMDPAALRTLDRAVASCELAPKFSVDEVALVPGAPGAREGLGRILAFVAAAMADGTWPRLKACLRDSCRWAFYDHARNRTGKWCSMSVCGNRTKAERFRSRRASG